MANNFLIVKVYIINCFFYTYFEGKVIEVEVNQLVQMLTNRVQMFKISCSKPKRLAIIRLASLGYFLLVVIKQPLMLCPLRIFVTTLSQFRNQDK